VFSEFGSPSGLLCGEEVAKTACQMRCRLLMARGRADGGLATTHSTPDLFSIVLLVVVASVTVSVLRNVLLLSSG